jgi:queuine tRNA-ribosyltransferase
MPVGSQATVKTLTPAHLEEIGIGMLLSNTYHLYLRPGIEVVSRLGGLHRFMGWNRSILTDSGGFQIFSLSKLREISAEGVRFRSHIDGSQHFITPELAVRFQEELGSDVAMALDVCPSFQDSPEQVREATVTTHRWAERCLRAHTARGQALFAIAQGGFDPRLRAESAAYLAALDFPGYAIGGLSLGEPKQRTWEMLKVTAPLLPAQKPRYLMGVGSPEDILTAVELGVDMFDSVLPTRVARNGALFTDAGRVNIRNSHWKQRESPIDASCGCYTCRNFSAAYLHHLFRADELLAFSLASIHNLFYLQNLMGRIRQALEAGSFLTFKGQFLQGFRSTDEATRIAQKQKWLENQARLESPLKKGT